MNYDRQVFLESAIVALSAPARTKSVALALAWLSRVDSPVTNYSVSRITALTGLSRATVQRALRDLERLGFLSDVSYTVRETTATLSKPVVLPLATAAPEIPFFAPSLRPK